VYTVSAINPGGPIRLTDCSKNVDDFCSFHFLVALEEDYSNIHKEAYYPEHYFNVYNEASYMKVLKPKSEDEINEILDSIKPLENKTNLDNYLGNAISSHNLYNIYKAIRSGVNLNTQNIDESPLVLAASWDFPEAIKIMIENGANITMQLIDELWDIAIFQVEPRVFNIAQVLISLKLRPSSNYLENISQRVTKFIDEAWYEYISTRNQTITNTVELPEEDVHCPHCNAIFGFEDWTKILDSYSIQTEHYKNIMYGTE
jgi:hypothetical protein